MLYIVALEVMIEHCVIQSTLHWVAKGLRPLR